MKILHFFKTYYPESYGGTENVIHTISEIGFQHGLQSEVMYLSSRGKSRNESFSNYHVHRSKLDLYIASTGLSLSAFKDFKEVSSDADVVHYHFPWPFMDIVHFLSRIKKPTIVTYHADIVRQKYLYHLYKPIMYLFLNSVNRIVATSSEYCDTSPVLQLFKKKVSVIPVGIPDQIKRAAPDQLFLKWKNVLPPRFYLFVGTFRHYKGLHVLFDALKGVDFPVVIIGSGGLNKDYFLKPSEIELKNVHFLGALPEADKFAILKLCYGLVFPSHLRSEAFGITLLEGAMCEKPLISTEIGTGTTYVNRHRVTGLVVPPSDPVALREAMVELWHNEPLARQFGKNARIRYEQLFTADKMVASYMKLYQSLKNGDTA